SFCSVWRLRPAWAGLARARAAGRRVASAAALGRRYGLPLASVRRVEQVLRTHGIAVVGDYPQRTAIDARASVAAISRLFHVRFRDFRDVSGVTYHAPVGRP